MDSLDCFQLGAVMNNAMNSHGNLSVPLCCHFSWADRFLGEALLGRSDLVFDLLETGFQSGCAISRPARRAR